MRLIDADTMKKRVACDGLETPAERKRIIAIREWIDSQETVTREDLKNFDICPCCMQELMKDGVEN